jgi:coproporphyrinogen III oxidase-like Fe-S oxidoreductase
MYALPAQTLSEAEQDIATVCAYAPPHISAYHLTVEPNTEFYLRPPKLPDDDVSADMQICVEQHLAKQGYQHYETSAFSKLNQQSQHNKNYWQYGDYLGIGAGAHSKISFADRIVRQVRYKQPKEYMERVTRGSGIRTETEVTARERPFEFMMNALRLIDGVESRLFEERTGVALVAIQRELADAEREGYIERDVVRLRPTLRGQRFLNEVLQIFL